MTTNIFHLPEPVTTVENVYLPMIGSQVKLPVFLESVSAGFPSPADDYIEDSLDLNEKFIHNPAATFLVRVKGNSMTGAGICPGDILIVDCSAEPTDGKIVIAALHGELTVKRLRREGGRVFLQPENSAYKPIEITETMEATIWGVVTTLIRSL